MRTRTELVLKLLIDHYMFILKYNISIWLIIDLTIVIIIIIVSRYAYILQIMLGNSWIINNKKKQKCLFIRMNQENRLEGPWISLYFIPKVY